MPNEILVVFHNGLKCDYHFIIKKLANEFDGQFKCIDKNNENYKTFSVPIKKEITRIDQEVNATVVNISYKIEFIDSMRFMASSSSNLVDNLAEKIHKIKCKDCDWFLEYKSDKDN